MRFKTTYHLQIFWILTQCKQCCILNQCVLICKTWREWNVLAWYFIKSCTTFYTRIIHIRTIRSFLLLFVFFCYLNLLVIIVSLTHNHSIQLKQLNLIEHIQILANKKYSCYGNISNFYCISHLSESYEY